MVDNSNLVPLILKDALLAFDYVFHFAKLILSALNPAFHPLIKKEKNT